MVTTQLLGSEPAWHGSELDPCALTILTAHKIVATNRIIVKAVINLNLFIEVPLLYKNFRSCSFRSGRQAPSLPFWIKGGAKGFCGVAAVEHVQQEDLIEQLSPQQQSCIDCHIARLPHA
jgi:hypothetical protein